MDLYKRVRSSPVLYAAWYKVKSSGLGSGSDKTKEAINKFSASWINNIRKIQDRLRDEKFSFLGERGVTPPKGKGKRGVRPIVNAPIENRIVRRAILDVLQGYGGEDEAKRSRWAGVAVVRKVMDTPTSVGGIKKRGVPHGLAVIDQAIAGGRSWFVRSDIRNFFTQIPKKDVAAFIEGAVADQRFISLFIRALETNLENKEELEERNYYKLFPDEETGVAQGSALSALAGNIALRSFDENMNKRGIVCVRYIDDFILLGESEAKVLKAYRAAQLHLQSMGMNVYDISDRKAQRDGKVDAGNIFNGTDVLGYRISGRSRQPSAAACTEFLSKIDKLMKRARDEIFDVTRNKSESHDFRYHQSMVKLHRLVWGWSQSFRHSTARQVFASLDDQIDSRISSLNSAFYRAVDKNDVVTRRRVAGIHRLSDTAIYDLPAVI